MGIRCAAKALIMDRGKILLNQCRRQDGWIYYDLPGGGQHVYESMEEAVLREVREETGLEIRILRFAALAEEINANEALREKEPDYTHRILHIFLAEPTDAAQTAPKELDLNMQGSIWIPVNEVRHLPELRPAAVQRRMTEILQSDAPVYLGTEYVDWE